MGRKQTMMPTMTGGGSGGRVTSILIGLVLLGLVLRDPVEAAHTVQQIAAWAGSALDALNTFGSSLSK